MPARERRAKELRNLTSLLSNYQTVAVKVLKRRGAA